MQSDPHMHIPTHAENQTHTCTETHVSARILQLAAEITAGTTVPPTLHMVARACPGA